MLTAAEAAGMFIADAGISTSVVAVGTALHPQLLAVVQAVLVAPLHKPGV
jgi:hypothetical protein